MMRAVEIRTYELKPGSRDQFDRMMRGHSLPMLLRWNVDVVGCGPSPHDDDSYVLVRSYRDLDERRASQDAFYGSEEWRAGPREAILAMIGQYASVVLMLDEDAIDALRRALGPR